jgi:phosphate uptake regulator
MDNIRRVQQGGSSLIISLPKSWTERMRIAKGDNVVCNPTRGKGTALVIKKLQQQEGGDL